MPGKYTVILNVNGKTYRQPLEVRMDPRVKTSTQDLAQQYRLSKEVYDQWRAFTEASEQLRRLRTEMDTRKAKIEPQELKTQLETVAKKFAELTGADTPGPAIGGKPTIQSSTGRLRSLFAVMQSVDVAPTPQVAAAVPEVLAEAATLAESLKSLTAQDLAALNEKLRAAGLEVIKY
jgi:hypothetical protein